MTMSLLKESLQTLHRATDNLTWSYDRCRTLDYQNLSLEDEEKVDAFTARFARMSDILIQKVFRLIDQLDLESPGTVRDRINRAEKKGLIDSARDFVVIRELRNAIALEYEEEALVNIHREVLRLAPCLLAVPVAVQHYVDNR